LGSALGLLAAPAQTLFEDFADVFGVVVDRPVSADQGGDTVCGPQVVGPAVLLGALPEELLQLLELPVPQTGAWTGEGSRLEPAFGARQASPAVDGSLMNAEDAGDDGRGLALLDECDGAAPAAFQFSC